jgi:hypothetical protein
LLVGGGGDGRVQLHVRTCLGKNSADDFEKLTVASS